MQEFIVTGRLPGTDFIITFHDLVAFAAVIAGGIMLWQIYKYLHAENIEKSSANETAQATDYTPNSRQQA